MVRIIFIFVDFNQFCKYIEKPNIRLGIRSINVNRINFINLIISSTLMIKNCLVVSTALFKTLKILGKEPTLIIGVHSVNSRFKSHSWVSLNNQSFIFRFDEDEEYKKILEFK